MENKIAPHSPGYLEDQVGTHLVNRVVLMKKQQQFDQSYQMFKKMRL